MTQKIQFKELVGSLNENLLLPFTKNQKFLINRLQKQGSSMEHSQEQPAFNPKFHSKQKHLNHHPKWLVTKKKSYEQLIEL